jgi:uncharacterized membrane protein YjjP (DUF1212 family)
VVICSLQFIKKGGNMLVNTIIAVVVFLLVQLLKKTKLPVKLAPILAIVLTVLALMLGGYLKLGNGLNCLDALLISAVVIISDSVLNMLKKP